MCTFVIIRLTMNDEPNDKLIKSSFAPSNNFASFVLVWCFVQIVPPFLLHLLLLRLSGIATQFLRANDFLFFLFGSFVFLSLRFEFNARINIKNLSQLVSVWRCEYDTVTKNQPNVPIANAYANGSTKISKNEKHTLLSLISNEKKIFL